MYKLVMVFGTEVEELLHKSWIPPAVGFTDAEVGMAQRALFWILSFSFFKSATAFSI